MELQSAAVTGEQTADTGARARGAVLETSRPHKENTLANTPDDKEGDKSVGGESATKKAGNCS
jgi:hypothetical protein